MTQGTPSAESLILSFMAAHALRPGPPVFVQQLYYGTVGAAQSKDAWETSAGGVSPGLADFQRGLATLCRTNYLRIDAVEGLEVVVFTQAGAQAVVAAQRGAPLPPAVAADLTEHDLRIASVERDRELVQTLRDMREHSAAQAREILAMRQQLAQLLGPGAAPQLPLPAQRPPIDVRLAP